MAEKNIKQKNKMISVDAEAYLILSKAKLEYIKEKPNEKASFNNVIRWMWNKINKS